VVVAPDFAVLVVVGSAVLVVAPVVVSAKA
jgi:hypothetical protein